MQQAALVNLVITTGEPAGIGPEVSLNGALAFLEEQENVCITLLVDPALIELSHNTSPQVAARLKFESVQLIQPVIPGVLNAANAQYVVSLLDQALEACLQKRFDAMITAPVQKSIINDAGILFTGHTEYLAQHCDVRHVVMMLCAPLPKGFLGIKQSRELRVALVTTHLPLQAVPAALNQDYILETIQIVAKDLQDRFGIAQPMMRMAGLNPHAGESGYLGREEIEVITPAIKAAQRLGIDVTGPYPGDTMFDAAALESVDAFIAMYHDQGLAPFKFVTFGGGVNVTLGLPIIRSSVDHGTALDIAGTGTADAGSMLEAIRLAYQLALNQRNHS
jgi:4-hydroxythreonine-4-phosphate dehydrogenase